MKKGYKYNEEGFYLYLFKFKDDIHFKFGETSSLKTRFNTHNKNYNIKIKDSIVFKFENKAELLVIEKLIKVKFPTQAEYNPNLDGYTEIRSLKHFDPIVNLIRNINYFIILEHRLVDYKTTLIPIKKQSRAVLKKTSKKKLILNDINDYYFEDSLIETIYNIFIELEKLTLNNSIMNYHIYNDESVYLLWSTKDATIFDKLNHPYNRHISYGLGMTSIGLMHIGKISGHDYLITKLNFPFNFINKYFKYGFKTLLKLHSSFFKKLSQKIELRFSEEENNFTSAFLKKYYK